MSGVCTLQAMVDDARVGLQSASPPAVFSFPRPIKTDSTWLCHLCRPHSPLVCPPAHLPKVPGMRALQAVVDDARVGQ